MGWKYFALNFIGSIIAGIGLLGTVRGKRPCHII